ncbi:MAG: tetratricopeptide repeat protein [Armatimonadota bacterium]
MQDAASLHIDALELTDLNARVEAEEYRTLGQERQAQGDVEDAAAYFQISLDLFPTAEAHTYLGWAIACRGSWEEAISECEKAIALDPDLGNPYNDIAVYLIELARLDEALPYLDRAVAAPRYDCRNYPYYHRGRILERKGRFMEARDAYRASLDIEPEWEPAKVAFHRALGFLN